jgi:hypothetical protein
MTAERDQSAVVVIETTAGPIRVRATLNSVVHALSDPDPPWPGWEEVTGGVVYVNPANVLAVRPAV